MCSYLSKAVALQLLLSPGPQFPAQLLIRRFLRMRPRLPDGQVEFPILDVALLRRRTPACVVDTLLWLHNHLVHLVHQILLVRLQTANDVCVNSPRVQRDGRDGRVAPR